MGQTKIEWCDKVWNPITGCSPVSDGCANCYAKRMANRLKGRYGYPKDDPFRAEVKTKKAEKKGKKKAGRLLDGKIWEEMP